MASVWHSSVVVPLQWISAFNGILVLLLLLTANWAHYWLDYYATHLQADPLPEYDFIVGKCFLPAISLLTRGEAWKPSSF